MTGLILPGMIEEPGCSAGSAIWPGVHPAQIVGDLHQRGRHDLELSAQFDGSILRRLRLEVIARLDEGQSGESSQLRRHAPAEFGMGVEAGPHRRAPDRQLGQARQCPLDARNPFRDLRRPSADLLPQADRRGIHQMRAPGLDHIVSGRGLRSQHLMQMT